MKTDFDEIELHVMEKILLNDSSDYAILMEQYRNRLSVNRDINKCGWYTHFTMKEGMKMIAEKQQLRIGNVILAVSGMENGIGFVLHVENGQIDMLEAYTFDEYLPAKIEW
jgi:hypothetical protein